MTLHILILFIHGYLQWYNSNLTSQLGAYLSLVVVEEKLWSEELLSIIGKKLLE